MTLAGDLSEKLSNSCYAQRLQAMVVELQRNADTEPVDLFPQWDATETLVWFGTTFPFSDL